MIKLCDNRRKHEPHDFGEHHCIGRRYDGEYDRFADVVKIGRIIQKGEV